MGVGVFVMTDIVGSTRRWTADSAEMARALTIHDATLATVFATRGGEVFKHTGDGMLAVFEQPDAAVAAACELVSALEGAEWEGIEPLRIRVSVHAGPSTRRDGDHFGPTINCVARVNDLAHPGQVLATDTVRELHTTAIGNDLGMVVLRDFAEPVRLWQLDDGHHPAVGTAGRPRNSLPSMPTEFFGRSAEIGEIRQLLAEHRLVTILGVGGCGKTRLAIEAAAGLQREFPGGVWFVDLTPERTAEGVASALARGTGITDQVGEVDIITACAAAFTTPTLVVVDNCEHVIDESAAIVDDLVTQAGHVTILATSREALAVPGEHIWQIPTMAHEAEVLFVDRARAAGVDITDEQLDEVSAICEQLDRIPFAIELAAGQLRSLPLSELSQRLGQGFAVLDGGRGRRRRRHQTLAAMIDWSYELLEADEQALLADLAVFAGSFSADAAHAIATVDRPILALQSLVEQSMVVLDTGAGRYRLLETIRFYGLELLARDGRLETQRDRLLEWALDLAALSRRPQLTSEQMRSIELTHYLEGHHILSALTWAEERGRRDDVFDLFAGAQAGIMTIDPVANRAWFERLRAPTTAIDEMLWNLQEVTCAYSLGEEYWLHEGIERAAEIVWTLPDDELIRLQDSVAYVLLFWANRSGLLGDTDTELERVAVMAELAARLPELVDLEWARWQCTVDAYRRTDDPRAVAAMEQAIEVSQHCRLIPFQTAKMFAPPTFSQFGAHERSVDIGLTCLLDPYGASASFRIAMVPAVATSLAALGRPHEALTVIDLDQGPLTGLVQRRLRDARAGGLAAILASLDDHEFVADLIGTALAPWSRVSSAPVRFSYARVLGSIESVDDAIAGVTGRSDAEYDALVAAAHRRAAELCGR